MILEKYFKTTIDQANWSKFFQVAASSSLGMRIIVA
jgi:hypothetical protein